MAKGGKQPGAGRPKGSKNKFTKELKDMILGALDESGGQAYLVEQAKNHPVAFLTLIGKILPREPVQVDIGTPPGEQGTPTFIYNVVQPTDKPE